MNNDILIAKREELEIITGLHYPFSLKYNVDQYKFLAEAGRYTNAQLGIIFGVATNSICKLKRRIKANQC
ncbi:MAG: hypothetical protein HRU38_20700 [Saccharospirillaceae bacterium]|nr:hypothetical protein [Saccharospirillaceae bacterium]